MFDLMIKTISKIGNSQGIMLDAALMDVTRANWPTAKEGLKTTVAKLAKPKLATDANLDDLHAFIDREGKPVRPPASFQKKMDAVFREPSS